MARRTLIALLLALAPATAVAAEAEKPPEKHWSFAGPFGSFEQASVQRGFQVYKEVCAACHTMNNLTYRNLGEPDGPFVAHGKFDKATSQWNDVALGLPHHGGKVIPANDNPYVRAIAAERDITEINTTNGEEVTRKALPSDRFVSPYANPYQAVAVHGVAPPDLSVIVKARQGGADYIAAFLTGYQDPPKGHEPPAANLVWNRYFPGGWVSMPPQLTPDRVVYADGTPATPEQMSKDVATFLAWAAEPKQIERKRMGFAVLAFLMALAALLYAAYRQVWSDVKH